MDGESIDPIRILRFIESLNVDQYPYPVERNGHIKIDLAAWERPKEVLPDKKPGIQTPFCPGCGLGILRNSLMEGIRELNLPKDKMAVVSGIGCTARLPNHLPFDSANTTHGYPVAFSTGVKLTNPELKVVVVSGDGDLFDIGCGHTVHGARRNLPMLVICYNNFVFGMTGGQVAPTTPIGAITSTTTRGNEKPPMDLVKLMLGLNVGYVARCPISKPILLKRYIKEALSYNGFAFIEVISPCLTKYSKKNRLGSQSEIWQRLNNTYVEKSRIQSLSEDEIQEKYYTLFPEKSEYQPKEALNITYGKFSNLKEYIEIAKEFK
jgi:2-oxoglutarate/2-oxoacid ferredoxin oxidoreductase subunit beta